MISLPCGIKKKKKELIETETGLVVARGVGGRAGEIGAGSQKV